VPETSSQISLKLLLGLLNSKLLDWYFRLGSTNSKVNEYQFDNLLCPIFRDATAAEEEIGRDILRAIENTPEHIPEIVSPLCETGPFSSIVGQTIEMMVERIRFLEERRGQITRSERAHLAPEAQPFQSALDEIFFSLAGLTREQSRALEE